MEDAVRQCSKDPFSDRISRGSYFFCAMEECRAEILDRGKVSPAPPTATVAAAAERGARTLAEEHVRVVYGF